MFSNRLNAGTLDTKLAYKKETDAFLITWGTFCCATYGNLTTVHSYRGSKFTRAVPYIEKEDPETW